MPPTNKTSLTALDIAITKDHAARATQKFRDPKHTIDGSPRAHVQLDALKTLWFNTGTLCNIECAGCYIESSPRNDRLVYLSHGDVTAYLEEAANDHKQLTEIGLTGGEPFMNPDIIAILTECLSRGYDALVLTNAMKPLWHKRSALLALKETFADKLKVRVSLDHYTQGGNDAVRGPGSWDSAIKGLTWLAGAGFHLSIASRTPVNETEDHLRAGFAKLFEEIGVAVPVDDPARLIVFPEMDELADIPEITEACWGILGKSPADVMCSSARMVVKHKGAAHPTVVACTLLPYDPRFDLGQTLAEASGGVSLNHPHCAKFCVLGGASCSA